MPPGLYFYSNFGTILLNKKRSNVKSIGRPWLRDLEWLFFRAWLEARGFSGFSEDEQFSGNFLLLEPDITDEFLLFNYPDVFDSEGNRKEFRHPRTLLEMQHPYHKGAPLYENEAHNLLMLGSRDTGKALPNDTEIPHVDTSLRRIADLQIGDQIYSKDGTPTTVVGVFPQGLRPCYRLHFRDGRSLEVDEEHLSVMTYKNKETVFTTKQLLQVYKSERTKSFKNSKGVEYNCFLPKSEAVEYEKHDLPLDPYTLGVLIGDGSLTQNIGFSTDDPEILDYIPFECKKLSAKFAYSIKGINHIIKDLGLKCKSEHKFIPYFYLTGTIEQRYELLRGLMDTDGSVSKDGTVEFSTSSSVLAQHMLRLVRSLGIIATIRERKTSGLNN